MSKQCSVCRELKPATAFYKASRSKDGLANRCRACDLQYQQSRKTEKAQAQRRWYEKAGNKQLAQRRAKTKARREEYLQAKLQTQDLSKWRRQQAQRALQKQRATPVWVNAEHHARIRQIYALAQLLQEATAMVYHVDHIVPLFSDSVCGLHVWWNLQPLSEATNMLKNNTFDPRAYPEQGVVAFPSPDGLIAAQFAVPLEKVEKANE
jgi:hypothetical protein